MGSVELSSLVRSLLKQRSCSRVSNVSQVPPTTKTLGLWSVGLETLGPARSKVKDDDRNVELSYIWTQQYVSLLANDATEASKANDRPVLREEIG